MRLLDRLRHTLVVRYALVGGVAACVDIGFFAVFARILGYPYLWVAAVGFLLGTAVNYVLARRLVFPEGSRFGRRAEVGLVYLVSLLGLGLHQVLLYGGVETAGLGLMEAKLVATGTVFFWNFLARKHFVFAREARA